MAAYVQVGVFEQNGGVTSPTSVSLTGAHSGNTIALVAANQGGAGITFTTISDGHNTYNACAGANCNGNSTQMNMYYATGIVGGTLNISVSWTGTANSLALYAFELSGATLYDSGSGNTAASSATASSGSFTTNHLNEIIVAATINVDSATSHGTGYTLIEITPGFADCLEYAIVNAGGQNATANLSGPQEWGMVAGAFYSPPVVLPTDTMFFGMI